MQFKQRRELKRTKIEIIPMIDTIFFLLVFFMITSLSLVRLRGMPIAVPADASPASSAHGAASADTPPQVLTLTAQGEYYFGRERVGTDQAALAAALRAGLTAHPHSVLVFNFAKTQDTQALVACMDTANEVERATGIAAPMEIATEPIDADGHALSAPAAGK
jgi:biopolymer transport protein ExbD